MVTNTELNRIVAARNARLLQTKTPKKRVNNAYQFNTRVSVSPRVGIVEQMRAEVYANIK